MQSYNAVSSQESSIDEPYVDATEPGQFPNLHYSDLELHVYLNLAFE